MCVHAGLSPDLQSMEQIRRIMRPTDVPDQGMLCTGAQFQCLQVCKGCSDDSACE